MIELLISSAILITVLAVLRVLFRGRIPPGLQYALWLLVLLRLFLPFHLFPSPVSAAGAITHALQTGQVDAAEQTVYQPDACVSVEADHPAADNRSFEHILRYSWLTGSAAAALWFGIVNGKLAVCLRRTRRRLEYPAPVPIYIADGLSSPCLYGLFSPAVYLTEQAAHDPQSAHITITHELTHWRHRDHFWSAARVLSLIVYWYDPFVWLAARLSKQDGELYCDECAIRSLGEEQRYAYGRVLLALSEAAVRPADLLCTASTISGGARRMRERIASIAHRPRRSPLLSVLAVVVTLAAAACTFSGSSEALEAEPLKITPTSPPLIIETPASEDVVPALPPITISETDTEKTIVSTPVPTQAPENTPSPAPARSTMSTPIPTEAAYREDTTDDETPSGGGGGAPRIQWAEAASGGSPPTKTPLQAGPATPTDDEAPPIATPPADETEPVIVRDMRDVYMNTGLDPYPDMPSTVPDSPPPTAVSDSPEGE